MHSYYHAAVFLMKIRFKPGDSVLCWEIEDCKSWTRIFWWVLIVLCSPLPWLLRISYQSSQLLVSG